MWLTHKQYDQYGISNRFFRIGKNVEQHSCGHATNKAPAFVGLRTLAHILPAYNKQPKMEQLAISTWVIIQLDRANKPVCIQFAKPAPTWISTQNYQMVIKWGWIRNIRFQTMDLWDVGLFSPFSDKLHRIHKIHGLKQKVVGLFPRLEPIRLTPFAGNSWWRNSWHSFRSTWGGQNWGVNPPMAIHSHSKMKEMSFESMGLQRFFCTFLLRMSNPWIVDAAVCKLGWHYKLGLRPTAVVPNTSLLETTLKFLRRNDRCQW